MKLSNKASLITALIITVIACSPQEKKNNQKLANKIIINNAWVRPADKGTNSAIYLTIDNRASTADTLIAVNTAVSDMASVHQTTRENGMTGMHHVKTVVIEAHSKLILKPGGYHIMLMDLNQSLQKKDTLKLNLTFARAGKKNILVPVKTSAQTSS